MNKFLAFMAILLGIIGTANASEVTIIYPTNYKKVTYNVPENGGYKLSAFGTLDALYTKGIGLDDGNYRSKVGLEVTKGNLPVSIQFGYDRIGNFKNSNAYNGGFIGITYKQCVLGC